MQLDYLAGYAQHSLLRWRLCIYAGVAHLVERHLAKVEVAGSSPVARSTNESRSKEQLLLFSIWRHSQVVRHGSAKP